MKAIIIGATGATGKDLLELLLADEAVSSVTVFVRRDTGIAHQKLTTHVVDFNNIAEWADLIVGDVLFSMLGTTKAAAGSKEAQWKVDYTYQYEVAKAARANGVATLALMSAWGADAASSMFYSRMKGELEDAVRKLDFPQLVIARPPSLIRKDTDRLGEKLTLPVLWVLNAVGLFRNMSPITTENVARAMILQVKTGVSAVLEGKELRNGRRPTKRS